MRPVIVCLVLNLVALVWGNGDLAYYEQGTNVIMSFTAGIAVSNLSTTEIQLAKVQQAIVNATASVESLGVYSYDIKPQSLRFIADFRRLEEIEGDPILSESFKSRRLQLNEFNFSIPIQYAVIATTLSAWSIGCNSVTAVACYQNISKALETYTASGLFTEILRLDAYSSHLTPVTYSSVVGVAMGGLEVDPMTAYPTMMPTGYLRVDYLIAQKIVLIPFGAMLVALLASSCLCWSSKTYIHMVFEIVLRLSDLMEDLICLLFSQGKYDAGSDAHYVFTLFVAFAIAKTVLQYIFDYVEYESLSAFVVNGLTEFVQAIMYSYVCGNTPTSIALFGATAVLQSVGSLMQVDNFNLLLAQLRFKKLPPKSISLMASILANKILFALTGLFFSLCNSAELQTVSFQILLTVYLWSADLSNSVGMEGQEFLIMLDKLLRPLFTAAAEANQHNEIIHHAESGNFEIPLADVDADINNPIASTTRNTATTNNNNRLPTAGPGRAPAPAAAPAPAPAPLVATVATDLAIRPSASTPTAPAAEALDEWNVEPAGDRASTAPGGPGDVLRLPTERQQFSYHAVSKLQEIAPILNHTTMSAEIKSLFGTYASYLSYTTTISFILCFSTFFALFGMSLPVFASSNPASFQFGFLLYIIIAGSTAMCVSVCFGCTRYTRGDPNAVGTMQAPPPEAAPAAVA